MYMFSEHGDVEMELTKLSSSNDTGEAAPEGADMKKYHMRRHTMGPIVVRFILSRIHSYVSHLWD